MDDVIAEPEGSHEPTEFKKHPRKAVASGWIGSALEYYDFFIHAQAAALVSPGLVLAGHPCDQCGDRVVEGWATGAVRVGPLLGHQPTVPPQHGGRRDQAMTTRHRG